jgi:beta-mannosidase
MTLTPPGAKWFFSNSSNPKLYPAKVPSTFHMDLLDNKLVDDPYYRDNLLEFYKYERENWTYTRSFFVDGEYANRKQIEMVFEGLDTHARIEINGIYLGDTDNAHRTWVFPVDKTFVNVGQTNTITIIFKSAVLYDLAAESVFNQTYNMTLPFNYSFSRKPAYHYGWDWGPRLVTAGIWKDIKIRAYNDL